MHDGIPEEITFAEMIALTDRHYDYSPCGFHNGELYNEAGTNVGSKKLFAFAGLHGWNEEQVLQAFAEYYRSVLDEPNGDSHQNIRNFMRAGWSGIEA